MRKMSAISQLGLALLVLWHVAACGGSEASKPKETTTPDTAAASEQVKPAKNPFAEVHAYLEQLVEEKRIAGAVAMVMHKDQVVYADTVGMQDVEGAKPMAKDSIFRIASMTKPITSVAAMILVDEGKLSLSDPVSKYIPEFKKTMVAVPNPKKEGTYQKVKATREITVEDLLTHRSGITYGFIGGPYFGKLYRDAGIADGLSETKLTTAENAKRIAKAPLTHQPGEKWTYGLNTDVLGRVVEVASGMSLDQFFYERIFKPLQMKDTHFHLPAEDEGRLATVYQPKEDDKTIERLPEGSAQRNGGQYSASYPLNREGKYLSGGAGLVSTVDDYARFLQMLRNGGELDGVRILKAETVAEMTKSRVDAINPSGAGFGLGFGVVSEAQAGTEPSSVGSYSWGGFFNTHFWVDPQKQVIGVLMTQLYPFDHLNMGDEFRKKTYAALGGE